jgi:16S rRNA processing protein RimM
MSTQTPESTPQSSSSQTPSQPDRTARRSAPQRGSTRGDTYYVRNQAVVVPKGYLAVGQIVGAHGLTGELRVEAYSDFPERFAPDSVLYLGEELEPVTVTAVRPHKANLLLRLEEVDDRNAAEDVRGLWLYVPETEAAALEEGQYWIHDIIGLQVVTDAGQVIGKITDVMATGANDVYVVHPADGVNGGRDVLLPAIEDVVARVDIEQGIMVIHLLEGLIDL